MSTRELRADDSQASVRISRHGNPLQGLARKLTFVEPKLASKLMSARDELKPIESTGLTGRSSALAVVRDASWLRCYECLLT